MFNLSKLPLHLELGLSLIWVCCLTTERSPVTAATNSHAAPIFIFHKDEFWLNLHHFLYVLGRAQNKTRDSGREAVNRAPADQEQVLNTLQADQQALWREAVAAYVLSLSKKDLIFDDPLPDITNALARAGSAKSLKGTGIDPATIKILEGAAPIYRRAWWPKHRAANQAWEAAVQTLVKQYGATVLAFIEKAYGMKWPTAGYNVHISAYTNWAGAYSTKGELLVVSSLSEGNQADNGLEIIFHEGMHQWDDLIQKALDQQAARVGKKLPPNLSHALVFFTAGEAVRRVIPGHERYADKFGVWQRGMTRERDALEQIWKPYLDGHGTRDEAFAELIKRLAN